MSNEKMREARNNLVRIEKYLSTQPAEYCGYMDNYFSAELSSIEAALSQQGEAVDDWLVYCLEYIGAGDPDDIECDAYELYSENDEGQSGTITVSISETCRKAAAALQSPQPSAQVPEGYALVPKEITEDMAGAYFGVIDKNLARVSTDCRFGRYDSQKEAYRAMLAAAPSIAEKR